jgi:acyl-CoA thioesterase
VSALEEALALTASDDGHWLAHADQRYESITGMFGGWATAVLLRSVLNNPERQGLPSAITINFVGKIAPGTDVVLRNRQLGGSRSIHHWQAEASSIEEETLAFATLVLTDRKDTDGLTQPSMPDAPDPDTLEVFHPPGTQGERTLMRPVSGAPPFGRNNTSSVAWVKDTSGRPIDHLQLAFLSDAYAPRSFFWSEGPRLSATMTLSVYFHGSDEEIEAVGDDYLLVEAVGTRGDQSTSGQQARLWSRPGNLLATTEQLCWYR